MKVQQDGHQADPVPPGGREHEVEIRDHRGVDSERLACSIELDARPRIAQDEYADDGDAIASHCGQRLVEPLQGGRLPADASLWKPGTCTHICAVPDPR